MELATILAEIVPDGHYVGGIVRNSLLKRQSGDIDITLPADQVKQAAQTLAHRLNAASFEMDPELGVWRLVTHEDKIQIDLTAYQRDRHHHDPGGAHRARSSFRQGKREEDAVPGQPEKHRPVRPVLRTEQQQCRID